MTSGTGPLSPAPGNPADAGRAASAPSPSAADLRLERIRDDVYVLRGGGRTVQAGGAPLPSAGNTLVVVGSEGVVLVDTKLPGWGLPIQEKLREITDKPVTTIINTHTHLDHVGGNTEFPAGIEIVAHERTAALMREMRPVSGGPAPANPFATSGGRGLPTRTFRDRLTLGRGDERIEIRFFGRAHTGGDAWVHVPARGLVHTGDAFAHKAVPPIDLQNGANALDYPETLARAAAELSGVDTVVTGHFPATLAPSDLRTYSEFVREFVESVRASRRGGATIDDFAAAWRIPERYEGQGYVSFVHLRPIRADVEAIWNELASAER